MGSWYLSIQLFIPCVPEDKVYTEWPMPIELDPRWIKERKREMTNKKTKDMVVKKSN